MYIHIQMILFYYVCSLCCLFCFVFYHGIYCLASQMVATSSNAWASSIQTPRTLQWIWWVCCGCRCFNVIQWTWNICWVKLFVQVRFFLRLKKNSPDSHPPSPKFATKSSSLDVVIGHFSSVFVTERSGILWKIRDIKALKVFGQCSGLRQVVWKKYSLEFFQQIAPEIIGSQKEGTWKKHHFFRGKRLNFRGVCFICTLDLGKWSNLTI